MSTAIKTMNREITNGEDIIDSRDVIARIEALESERDDFEPEPLTVADATDPALAVDDRPAQTWAEAWPEEAAELTALKALADEAEGCAGDWTHGAALIRDSYFEDYARELAEDIGAIGRDASWPACHIDWEAAADALKQDYTCVDFDGVEYWVRS